jgi:hypothetical protein
VFGIPVRPQRKMKMIGHQTICRDAHTGAGQLKSGTKLLNARYTRHAIKSMVWLRDSDEQANGDKGVGSLFMNVLADRGDLTSTQRQVVSQFLIIQSSRSNVDLTARRHTQFSVLSPTTRPKCFALFVTNINPNDRAWAAMRVSNVPMGTPRRASEAATAAKRSAAG